MMASSQQWARAVEAWGTPTVPPAAQAQAKMGAGRCAQSYAHLILLRWLLLLLLLGSRGGRGATGGRGGSSSTATTCCSHVCVGEGGETACRSKHVHELM